MRTTLLIAASALCLLTGCMEYQITFANPEENYLTFNHPFTDSAIAAVEAKATEMCAQRKQGVIQRLCSRSLWLSMASHGQGQPLSGFQTKG